MPIRLPSVSNSPPPDEPGDMAALRLMTGVVAGAYGRFLIASIRRHAASFCAERISVCDKRSRQLTFAHYIRRAFTVGCLGNRKPDICLAIIFGNASA